VVKGSKQTYGEHMQKAREMTDRMEIGEVQPYVEKRVLECIEEAVNLQSEAGKFYPKYYIWHIYTKDPYANNTLHIYPQNRLTRPSPHQYPNSALWSVTNMNEIKHEWSVMDAGMRKYVKANPNMFHQDTVRSVKDFSNDKLEVLSDYLVDGKIM
jgi:hypothetical protein